MITLFNFLDKDTLELAHLEVAQLRTTARWMVSGNCWGKELVGGAVIGNVAQTSASSTLTNKIITSLIPHVKRCSKIEVQHYLWHPLSGINMHNDFSYAFGATIYLTPEWDMDWGGLFIYQNGDHYRVIPPVYNSININTDETDHAVTTVSPLAPYPRHTLQIWGYNNET